MSGPCAKRSVACVLVLPDGGRITGTNDCANPQATCPREDGEGYEKCVTVCGQYGHAEAVAVRLAEKLGVRLTGARAYVMGHAYACMQCQLALFGAGVASLSVGAPPPSD
jgi:deoxycytidylate deaminase